MKKMLLIFNLMLILAFQWDVDAAPTTEKAGKGTTPVPGKASGSTTDPSIDKLETSGAENTLSKLPEAAGGGDKSSVTAPSIRDHTENLPGDDHTHDPETCEDESHDHTNHKKE